MSIASRKISKKPTPYRGTSAGPTGYRLSEMFGGDGNGSWINTPMPNNTTIHADSTTAVNDLLLNIYQYATGLPSKIAWPSISEATWTSTLNVVDSSKISWQPVTIVGNNATQSWAFRTAAMMYAGFPIPRGLEPTNDTDGTIHIYDPDWKWPGRPADTQYWGAIWELWGAQSPSQNAALGNPAIWTAKHGGRLTGVNQRLIGHAIGRTYGTDVDNQTNPLFGAPKAPNDTGITDIYWGAGRQGVYESVAYMASACHLPMSHHILRISDVQQGVVKHPLGFSLYPMQPASEGNKGYVWPATGSDAASRNWLKHGNRLRLPYNYVKTYPGAMPVSWRPFFDLYVNCFRDYGVIMVDTTGSTFGMRAEPGVSQYWPTGFNTKQFLQYLPWADMQMIAVGSDANFYP